MKTTSLVKDTRADKIFLVFVYFFLAIALLIVLYPLIYIVSASISNPHLV
ncbi:carbohydrate ABC transporter permease, partial [Enterococcus faecalis]